MTVKELQIEERLNELLVPVRLTVKGFNLPFEEVETFKKDLITFIKNEVKEAEHQGQKNLLERIIQDMFNASALNIPMNYIYHLKKEINPSKVENAKG